MANTDDLLERFLAFLLADLVLDTGPGEVARRLFLQVILGLLSAVAVGSAVSLFGHSAIARWFALATFLGYLIVAYLRFRLGPRRPSRNRRFH